MKAKARKRWFRFSYQAPRIGEAPLLPHHLRDGDAALFLSPVLTELGYEYAGLIFNYPHPAPRPQEEIPVDEGLLNLLPPDLLVLTTRPPLDDFREGGKRLVLESRTQLEKRVFDALKPRHLLKCSRAEVIVADEHARGFPEVAALQDCKFKKNRKGFNLGASVESFKRYSSPKWEHPEGGREITLTYMFYVEQAWHGGPALLTVFGMGGTETLVWAYRLATQYRGVIGSRHVPFLMAEFTEPGRPERPDTMAFADHWNVRLLTPYSSETTHASRVPPAGKRGR